MSDANFELKPVYDFLSEKERYELSCSNTRVTIKGNEYEGSGCAMLQLIPHPRILIESQFQANIEFDALSDMSTGDSKPKFEFGGKTIKGYSGIPYRTDDTDREDINYPWIPKKKPVIGVGEPDTKITYLIFHLFNFREIRGSELESEKRGEKTRYINKLDLQSGDLHVTIKSFFESPEIKEKIKTCGGARMTHVALLKNANGEHFTGEQAIRYLGQLKHILSFANGKWCLPVCACGFNENNEKVWEAWSSPIYESGPTYSWFYELQPDQLHEFFNCYFEKTRDDTWRKPIREAIYWYLNANNIKRGKDAGIILTQSALELLSYTYCVQDKNLESSAKFKSRPASAKIKLLFTSIGIPTDIPPECEIVHSLNDDNNNILNWDDLPHVLTAVRNSIIHPEKKNRDDYNSTYLEVWHAGLWCLELTILRLCGFKGKYMNRMSKRVGGHYLEVPWT